MNKARRIGAYAVLRDDAGRVLLARSSERSDVVGTWYLPGGGIEQGEHPADTVVREVAEETGLRIAHPTLRAAVADVLEIPARDQLLHTDRLLYDASVAGGELRAEPSGTTDEVRWVSVDEAAGLRLMPFVARALGLPATPARVRPDLPPGEVLTPPEVRPTAKQRLAAYALVADPDGRILLTLNADGYPGAAQWHLPGGGTDHGEQPADAVLREVYEESAQRGELTDLLAAGSYHDPAELGPEGYPLDWHQVQVLYRVLVRRPTKPEVLDVGGSTARAEWYAPDEAAELPLTVAAAWALNLPLLL